VLHLRLVDGMDEDAEAKTQDTSAMPYCRSSWCQQWDAAEAFRASGDTFVVTTFVRDKLQRHTLDRWQPGATDDGAGVPLWEDVASASFFVADVERYVVVVEHAVAASGGAVRGTKAMPLTVVCVNGTELSPPRDSPVAMLSLRDVLACANVTLEDSSADFGRKKSRTRDSVRERGVVVQMTVEYSNTRRQWFGTNEVEARATVAAIPGIGHRDVIVVSNPQPRHVAALLRLRHDSARSSNESLVQDDMRVVRKVNGVKLVVADVWALGSPSFSAALHACATYFFLFSIPFYVVDTILYSWHRDLVSRAAAVKVE
jgi:hypothetical protein